MFTGIITEVGAIASLRRVGGGVHLGIHAPKSSGELAIHDSVSIDGVCLTVIARTDVTFTVEAVEETLRKTTIGGLKQSSRVNLELPLRLGDRLGGHLVLGHVDGIGRVISVEKRASSWLVGIEFPSVFERYVIPVGSIAVDGISLTVATLQGNRFGVSVIPYTLEHTTLADAEVGRSVNLEFDMVGKYIENFVRRSSHDRVGLSEEILRQWGYGS